MLDLFTFLANRAKDTNTVSYSRLADFKDCILNTDNCRYLLNMQRNEKVFQLSCNIYIKIVEFLGADGLKIFANYAKRHFKKYSSREEHTEYILSEIAKSCEQKYHEGWLFLYRLLNSEQWNSAVNKILDINHILSFLLRLAIRAGEQSQNKIFEKRLNTLCETLNLDKVNKDILKNFCGAGGDFCNLTLPHNDFLNRIPLFNYINASFLRLCIAKWLAF